MVKSTKPNIKPSSVKSRYDNLPILPKPKTDFGKITIESLKRAKLDK